MASKLWGATVIIPDRQTLDASQPVLTTFTDRTAFTIGTKRFYEANRGDAALDLYHLILHHYRASRDTYCLQTDSSCTYCFCMDVQDATICQEDGTLCGSDDTKVHYRVEVTYLSRDKQGRPSIESLVK